MVVGGLIELRMMRNIIIAVVTTILLSTTFVLSSPSPSAQKNHELLTQLGFQRVRSPNSHHRKRLAVESRHNTRTDDSHMFVIKLPPNPHYYAYNHPNSIDSQSKNIPVGFKSNGKPAKVYHWNIPVLKKMVSTKMKSQRLNDYNGIDFQNPQSWNNILDKSHKVQKTHKQYYYIPAKPKRSHFMKYFPGNGKPHGFYVIEKSKKAHYHRLSE